MVQGPAAFSHQIADICLPQPDPVFDEAATLDTPLDRLDPPPTLVERLVRSLLRQHERLAAWLLGRHEDATCGSGNARRPRSCHNRLSLLLDSGVLRDEQLNERRQ
jgi:hypothetical protein